MLEYDVVEVSHVRPRVIRVRLKPVKEFLTYRAGQYIFLHRSDNLQEKLPFSVASPPDLAEGYLELLIYEPNPAGEHYWVWTQLRAQQRCCISQPQGRCIYPLQDPKIKDLILLAVGTGISPFLSVIPTHLSGIQSKAPILQSIPCIHLYWSDKYVEDLYEHAQFQKWTAEFPQYFKYQPMVLERNDVGIPMGEIPQFVPFEQWNPQQTQIYISASPTVGKECWQRARACGFTLEHCWADWFDFIAPEV